MRNQSKKTNHAASWRTIALAVIFAASTSLVPTVAHATAVPPAAVRLYQAGLAHKAQDAALALQEFREAVQLDPNWEPPLYEEGALLAVSNFTAAIPVLMQAAHVAPQDDTVWNILGWGYYQAHDFATAETAFLHQLSIRPDSGPGLWGLANCYGNSAVRDFAKARTTLNILAKQATYADMAHRLLANLPPDAVDGSYQANSPVTYEDAIAMILSWRNAALHFPTRTVLAASGKGASADVAAYVSYADAQGWFAHVSIPSFEAPASRLGLSLLLAQAYGIDAYDYIRPFALTDVTGLSVEQQMMINSILSTGLMTQTSPGHFSPHATMTRAAFAATVQRANAIMVRPPTAAELLTPPLPQSTAHPVLYFFATGQPAVATQDNDLLAHSAAISAIGLTYYPFIPDFPAGSAAVRQKQDGTRYLLTANSASPAIAAQLSLIEQAHIGAYMVLANYNNITDKADPVIVNQMIGTARMRHALVQEVIHIVLSEHLAGVTVDFENILASDRSAYVSFMRDLYTALGAIHKKTMVCLPERYSSSGQTSPYDYAALGHYANWVMLITYDEHVPHGPAGAIATLSNTQRVIQFAVEQIPPSKILLGAADYGYDWAGTQGVEVSMSQAKLLATKYHATIHVDATSDTPTFTYTDDSGERHVVWFEDDASIKAIAALVHLYGLAGLAVWHLGSEDSGFWQAVN